MNSAGVVENLSFYFLDFLNNDFLFDFHSLNLNDDNILLYLNMDHTQI